MQVTGTANEVNLFSRAVLTLAEKPGGVYSSVRHYGEIETDRMFTFLQCRYCSTVSENGERHGFKCPLTVLSSLDILKLDELGKPNRLPDEIESWYIQNQAQKDMLAAYNT